MSNVTSTIETEPTLNPSHRIRRHLPVWLAVVAVIVLAVNLRPGATSIGPLLSELRAGLHILGRGGAAECDATLLLRHHRRLRRPHRRSLRHHPHPGRRRPGDHRGLLGRVLVHGEMSFLALSVLALAGMAVGNVLAPVFVKRFFPGHVAGMMSVYTTVLPIGALAPSLLVPVIFASHPGNWQLNLVCGVLRPPSHWWCGWWSPPSRPMPGTCVT